MNLKLKISALAILALISGLACATQFIEPPSSPNIKNVTVFVAKKIVTMDPSIPTATAVAVSDGRILSVGSLEDMKPWTDKYPTRIDRQFASKVMYPGFIEAHGHPLLAGIVYSHPVITPSPLARPWGPAFPGVATLQAAIDQLKKYSADMKDPGQTLLSWGYDETVMGKVPDRQLLDQASATRPIIVWDNSGHNMYVNSAAIKAYALTPEKVK